ncbi:MAG: hypothetical protein FJX57_14015, partial [Alphaproteobacteria bacterium]|nr:hypothetical protein [Alphaproteobacteria bacterium]
MVGLRHEPPRRPAAADERLFMRRCLAHPLKVGAVLPSSQFLGRLVAKHTRRGPDEAVVELGTATTELLALEIPANKLFGIEIDGDLRRFPCREAPQDQLIHGDATRLEALLPPATIGKVRTVTSGIPMVTLPLELQRKMISAWFEVTPPDG